LAQLLRADLLPEAWIAPLAVRQLRALLRHRISLVRLGTRLRNRIHPVAADHGYDRPASYWTRPGRGWLAQLDLPAASRQIVTDCLAVQAAARKDPEEQSAQPGAPSSHRARFVRPLDTGGPYGCRWASGRFRPAWLLITASLEGSGLCIAGVHRNCHHMTCQGTVCRAC